MQRYYHKFFSFDAPTGSLGQKWLDVASNQKSTQAKIKDRDIPYKSSYNEAQ